MVREIVFDTETTGFNAEEGERLVEIGAVELINHIPTGKTYHQYINPEKEVPEEAYKVHGLSYDFLKDFPTFDKVADDWLEFIGEDSVLVAHNAQFDINFVNYELKQLGKPTLAWDRVVDTLEIARSMFPGARNNLDALCKKIWRRQQQPYQPRRPARCGTAGQGLPGADGRRGTDHGFGRQKGNQGGGQF